MKRDIITALIGGALIACGHGVAGALLVLAGVYLAAEKMRAAERRARKEAADRAAARENLSRAERIAWKRRFMEDLRGL